MIVENFLSKTMQEHYVCPRKQAIAYLFTTGAKALVLMEQKSNAAGFIGANVEAEVKKEIINEEKIRSIKRKLLEHHAIEVNKFSRYGKLRTVFLKVKHDSHHDLFIYKSKNNMKKVFTIDKTTTIEISHINYDPANVIHTGNQIVYIYI